MLGGWIYLMAQYGMRWCYPVSEEIRDGVIPFSEDMVLSRF